MENVLFFLNCRYQESGFMWRWFDSILTNKTNIMDYYLKPPVEGSLLEFEALDMEDLSGAFYLLAIGLFTSFIVFLIENIVFQIKFRFKKLKKIPNPPSPEPILIFQQLLDELPQKKHFPSSKPIL